VKKSVLLLLFVFQQLLLFAQQFEMVIKGGHVIDRKSGIDNILDVAIRRGRIAEMAKDIDTQNVSQVIDARGSYVVPGLIDIHTHVFFGPDPQRHFCNGTQSVRPDSISLRYGVTTVVDAGSSGWRDFPVFKIKVIDSSRVRVLAFLNIVGAGMRGRPFEQDTTDMDAEKAALSVGQYGNYIVGIKLAHYSGPGWKPVKETVRAGELTNLPVMIDFGENNSPLSLQELFMERLRSGDIFTHCFAQLKGRQTLVDTVSNQLKPFVWEAKKRGIRFDVGYGEISFSFSQARAAVSMGLYPTSISTDWHALANGNMKNILDIMSEFLAMGMSVPQIIEAVTWGPAEIIRHPELGNLSTGSVADIAILSLKDGQTAFYDHAGSRLNGNKIFSCAVTIKNGTVVYRAQ
jgi:dihydroorotase